MYIGPVGISFQRRKYISKGAAYGCRQAGGELPGR